MKQERVLSLTVIWICSVFTLLTVWADQPGFSRFTKHHGHRVENSFQTYSFVGHIQCMYNCYKLQETVCKSVNYNTALNTCELSNDRVTTSSDLLTEEGWTVFYLSGCEDGWIKGGGKCYKINNHTLSWSEAESYCALLGATLVIVDDDAEHTFMQNTFAGYTEHAYWIGLRYDSDHGGYRWIDDTEITFDAWYPGEPKPITFGCAHYLRSYGWSWNANNDCYKNLSSVCEKGVSD